MKKLPPDELARACAKAQLESDPCVRAAGMVMEEIASGHAVFSITVTQDMVNAHGICHGGLIFTLADTAFAYACNSHNQRAVAAACEITYLNSAKLGDVLVATAVERAHLERIGITDVAVTLRDGTLIAEFRGHSRTVKGFLIPELARNES
jgi:acyl-CoA thioesterase